jgi:putative flippase GtrA
MMSMVDHVKARPEMVRVLKFLVVGGLNTAFGYWVFVAVHLLGDNSAIAAIVSTIIGVVFNFMTTGRLVFGSAHSHQFLRFGLVYTGQVCVNIGLLALAQRWGIHAILAQLIILPCLAAGTYLALKHFVFDRPLEGQP